MLEKYKKSLSEKRAIYIILVVNVLVFIVLNAMPNIVEHFVLYPALDKILERPWTLVTVFFSHEIHVHLLVNMALILIFGTELEKSTSSKTVLLIYIIAGLAGSLTLPFFTLLIGSPVSEYAIGASAAAFGVVATFATLRPNFILLGSKTIVWAAGLFVANAVIAILNPEVSIGAGSHAVGLITGLIYGHLLKSKYEKTINDC